MNALSIQPAALSDPGPGMFAPLTAGTSTPTLPSLINTPDPAKQQAYFDGVFQAAMADGSNLTPDNPCYAFWTALQKVYSEATDASVGDILSAHRAWVRMINALKSYAGANSNLASANRAFESSIPEAVDQVAFFNKISSSVNTNISDPLAGDPNAPRSRETNPSAAWIKYASIV